MAFPHMFSSRTEESSYGPFGFLNPTIKQAQFELPQGQQAGQGGSHGRSEGDGHKNDPARKHEHRPRHVYRELRTRDNRKGRHPISIPPTSQNDPQYLIPPHTATLRDTLHTILLMFTYFPIWDISYLVASIFTLGSLVWVLNAFFVWLPLQSPSSAFDGEIANAGGISGFVGATIFEVGSVLLMVEAVNEKRGECFGWAVEEVFEGGKGVLRVRKGECGHHHGNRGNLVGKGKGKGDGGGKQSGDSSLLGMKLWSRRNWAWWPSWYDLKTHYVKEVGFLACSSQMIGATVFWISGFTALPPIYDRLSSSAAQNGAYWLPQVIGGTGFILSGTLFMLETQKKWYKPAFGNLGWHIGAWNLVGGIGFTLCGALGFASANSGCVYQGSLATFWGSWCFLIGSVIQWFESLGKWPVEVAEGASEEAGDA